MVHIGENGSVDESITIADLEVKFAITTNKIKQVLCSSPINVTEVVEQLQIISAVKNKHVPLFDEDVFDSVTTFEKLWQKLNKFWSIFNYDLLVTLLKIVECKRAEEILQEFLSRIDISAIEDMDLVLNCEVIEGEGSPKPVLRVKVGVEKCTKYIERKVEEIISSKFDLKEYKLYFRSIKKGCIELAYEISDAMMSYFIQCQFTGNDLAEFAAHNIICLQINDMKLEIPSEIIMVCTHATTMI